MKVVHCRSLADAMYRIRRHIAAKERAMDRAIERTAKKGAEHVRKNMPIAFGSLRDSVEATKNRIIADAPHAASVERGSRPHTPPLAPLIEWVKLRGMQALNSKGQVKPSKRLQGTTTREHAQSIGEELASMAAAGMQQVEDPEIIARAIQRKIANFGTKPHYYMRNAVPEVREILVSEVRKALKKDGE